MFQLRLFGGASIVGPDGVVTGKAARRHPHALLALLACSRARRLSRDKLIGYLWPERAAADARNLLNQAVHALRQALGEGAIRSEGDDLVLNPDVVACDVWTFEETLAAGDAERAVEVYVGPFLDGFFLPDSAEFGRWAEGERERLRRAYLKGLEKLAEAATARGDLAGAVERWRRLSAEAPYRSGVILGLMRSLEAAGDRAGAIREAEAHAERLRVDLDAAPNPEVLKLAERMRTQPIGPLTGANGPGPGAREAPGTAAADQFRPTPSRRSGRRAALAVAGLAVLILAGWAVTKTFERDARDVRRVAVLPLANLTGDDEQDYFVAGMHDALVAELGQIAALTVISRQSVIRYQDSDQPLPAIARELGVEALVEGSVFLAGDSVRITVQLVRAEPEEHLWAETYYGDLRDALALQGEVARAIARAIDARVAPAVESRLASRRRADPEAQDAYLRGLYHLQWQATTTTARPGGRRAALDSAIAYLEQAVALDSGWATAHAKLALAYHYRASGALDRQTKSEFYAKAKAAALRALEIDASEPQAHASLGFVLLLHEWDWAGAEREIRQALELEPSGYDHGIYAIYLLAAGRHDEAIDHYRQAEERNPLSEAHKVHVALAYSCAGRHDEAIAQFELLRSRLGDRVSWLRLDLGHEYLMTDRPAAAIAELQAAVELSDSSAVTVAGLAYGYARTGRLDEARALMSWLEARDTLARQAHPVDADRWLSIVPAVYAALGETDRAIATVEAAFDEVGNDWAPHYRCSWAYEALSTEPRFQALMRRVGFPE